MNEKRFNCSELLSKADLGCAEWIEFDYKQIEPSFKKGQIYSFINEYGKREEGKCLEYNEKTGRVKLEKI